MPGAVCPNAVPSVQRLGGLPVSVVLPVVAVGGVVDGDEGGAVALRRGDVGAIEGLRFGVSTARQQQRGGEQYRQQREAYDAGATRGQDARYAANDASQAHSLSIPLDASFSSRNADYPTCGA